MADVRFTKKALNNKHNTVTFFWAGYNTFFDLQFDENIDYNYNVLFYVLLLTVKNVKDIEKMMLQNNSKMMLMVYFIWVILAIVAEQK